MRGLGRVESGMREELSIVREKGEEQSVVVRE